MELRIYAATTGDAIAGARYGDYEDEQARVEADFMTGVRLAIDEVHGEIRGFVPADRGSQEAFVAAMSVPDGKLPSVTSYVEAVRSLFDEIDRWQIRTDTPEGRLLDALGSVEPDRVAPRLPTDPIRAGKGVQAGAPDLATAGTELRAVRASLAETTAPSVYVISLSLPVDHVDPDLVVQVASGHEDVQVLDD